MHNGHSPAARGTHMHPTEAPAGDRREDFGAGIL